MFAIAMSSFDIYPAAFCPAPLHVPPVPPTFFQKTWTLFWGLMASDRKFYFCVSLLLALVSVLVVFSTIYALFYPPRAAKKRTDGFAAASDKDDNDLPHSDGACVDVVINSSNPPPVHAAEHADAHGVLHASANAGGSSENAA